MRTGERPPMKESEGARRWIGRASGLVAVVIVLLVGSSNLAEASPPTTLGIPWALGQQGYGKVRPHRIFNGGDPTGLVSHVRWRGWGHRRAIGTGRAEYVWPGTDVASNGNTPGARVVAFHLGRCNGHPAYKAITWFFPKYDERFNPRSYINICTGDYHYPRVKLRSCTDTVLGRYTIIASYVSVSGMRCGPARHLIHMLKLHGLYRSHVSKWVTGTGWRCGSSGYNSELSDDQNYGCAKGRRYIGFSV